MEVLWLKEAIQDLKESGQFITGDDSAAAYRSLNQNRNLRKFPSLWHMLRSSWSGKSRELIVPV